jgi:hypothetical protein
MPAGPGRPGGGAGPAPTRALWHPPRIRVPGTRALFWLLRAAERRVRVRGLVLPCGRWPSCHIAPARLPAFFLRGVAPFQVAVHRCLSLLLQACNYPPAYALVEVCRPRVFAVGALLGCCAAARCVDGLAQPRRLPTP